MLQSRKHLERSLFCATARPFLLSLLAGFAAALPAQTPAGRSPSSVDEPASSPTVSFPSIETLPTAPLPATSNQATVTGQVTDPGGALIPGAKVVLSNQASAANRTAVTDSAGRFRFTGLRSGTYVVQITAPGFEQFTSTTIPIGAGEAPAPLTVKLAVGSDRADVTVTLTRKELANDQIHAEEKQRVLGIFPNFYTSFTPNPAPLDTRQKLSLAFRATTDPVTFLTVGLVASGEQLRNTFPEYGSGPEGYAKRYGADYADGVVGTMIGYAILPSLFRQDPRYFYMGTGTVKARTRHALLSAVLARHDTGRWEPNYSHILGNAAAGAISTTYHPASNSAGSLALDNALIGVGGSAVVNLVREFVLKPFTHGIQPTP